MSTGLLVFFATTPIIIARSPVTNPDTPIEGFTLVNAPDLLMYSTSPKLADVVMSVNLPELVNSPDELSEISVVVTPATLSEFASTDTSTTSNSPLELIITGVPLDIRLPVLLGLISSTPVLVSLL